MHEFLREVASMENRSPTIAVEFDVPPGCGMGRSCGLISTDQPARAAGRCS
jgi:pantoate kinase